MYVNLKVKRQLKNENGMWEDEVVDVVGEFGWGERNYKCVGVLDGWWVECREDRETTSVGNVQDLLRELQRYQRRDIDARNYTKSSG
jgi:hypothetical protein